MPLKVRFQPDLSDMVVCVFTICLVIIKIKHRVIYEECTSSDKQNICKKRGHQSLLQEDKVLVPMFTLVNKTKVERVQLGRLLKLSKFVAQKAAAPEWTRFLPEVHCIGVIRCSLAMPYDDMRRWSTFDQSKAEHFSFGTI